MYLIISGVLMSKTEAKLIKNLLISMRPYQWSKNLIIFAGLVFSRNLFSLTMFIKVFLAFCLFCLLSSSIYIINDIIDFKQDRNHFKNVFRPIAAKELDKNIALGMAILLFVVVTVASFFLNYSFGLVTVIYFVLMSSYSLILKRIVIIDIIIISLGFLLRAIAGAVVISVEFSAWLFSCAMLLALFLVIGKRKQETLFFQDKSMVYKQYLSRYPYLLDLIFSLVTVATVITYILYTICPATVEKFHSTNLKYTIFFVVYGLFRYLYLIYNKKIEDTKNKDI